MLLTLKISSNEIADIGAMTGIPVLKELDVSKNKIENVEGKWEEIPDLETLHAAGNLIASMEPLKALRKLPKLRTLSVAENPLCEALFEAAGIEDPTKVEASKNPVRLETLICHWNLDVLDGVPVTEEQREAARQLHLSRLEEEREKRLREEEAAAAAADAGDA